MIKCEYYDPITTTQNRRQFLNMNQHRLVSALRELLPLSDGELEQIILHASELDDAEATQHFGSLLGDSPKSLEFISYFLDARKTLSVRQDIDAGDSSSFLATDSAHMNEETGVNGSQLTTSGLDSKLVDQKSASQPPPYAASPGSQTVRRINQYTSTHHTNDLIEVSKIRARDEVIKTLPKSAYR